MKVLVVSNSSIDAPTKSLLYTPLQNANFSVTEAAPTTTAPSDTIPLASGAFAFPRNAWSVARWARAHCPTLYLSFGGIAASLAHIARRATGGNGMSVVYLSSLHSPKSWSFGAWLERRAILHCDRILVPSDDLAHRLITEYNARGGDIHVVSLHEPRIITNTIISFFKEPPGWMG